MYARNKEPLKNHSLDVAKKHLERNSVSNAVLQYLEERVQMNIKQYIPL